MSATPELPSKYDPAAAQDWCLKFWNEKGYFHSDPVRGKKEGKKPFTIVIPPPNVTGALHMGHALDNTLQDVLIRWRRMQGYEACWIPGTDHAGIATQAVVEKRLLETEKKTRHDVGREGLVERIWKWKDQYECRILGQLKQLGCSADWDRTRFTLDEMCSKAVRQTFFNFFKAGLIYRGKRLVNWDTHLQTAVADDEIYHEKTKGHFWTFKYPVVDPLTPNPSPQGGEGNQTEFLTFSTTRPETMLADVAVAIHPEDERYKHLHGKKLLCPLVGRIIPIITDALLVDPTLGTGAVKVTPAHDPNDYQCGLRHKLEMLSMMKADGTVSEVGGKYAGMTMPEARKAVVADMEALGLLEKVEDREIDLAHSDRSKTPIEPFLSDQWFVKMSDPENPLTPNPSPRGGEGNRVSPLSPGGRGAGGEGESLQNLSQPTPSPLTPLTRGGEGNQPGLAQLAMDAVTSGRVKFFPERYAKTYLDWLGEKRDWCISRQLWWGHRIASWSSAWSAFQSLFQANLLRIRYSPNYDLAIESIVTSVFKPEPNNDFPITNLTISDETDVVVIHLTNLDLMPAALKAAHAGFYPSFLSRHENSTYFCIQKPRKTTLEDVLSRLKEHKLEGNIVAEIYTDELIAVRAHLEENRREIHVSFADSKYVSAIERLGFVQDPDVLDTWFSSGLWPHSTLGWPEKTAEMDYYYPTSVLVTSRDIITLWVARMVLMSLSNLGEVPFHHVYIHPKVLDGFGEGMSKSKGNGVDPLDVISIYGTDALRFVICQMATETQDARLPVANVCPHCQTLVPVKQEHMYMRTKKLACPSCKKPFRPGGPWPTEDAELPTAKQTSDKFELGRNFATKLWNASRFVMMSLSPLSPGGKGAGGEGEGLQNLSQPTPSPLTPLPRGGEGNQTAGEGNLKLEDRWILSRLATVTQQVTQHLEAYEIAAAARLLYDFTWTEFCDWYVEMAKARLKIDSEKALAQQMLVGVLDTILRLLHPMMPFVTEMIWQALNGIAPQRGLPTAQVASDSIMIADWPVGLEQYQDQQRERQIARMQDLIKAIRNTRNEYRIDEKATVTVSVKCSDAVAAELEPLKPFIQSLGKVGELHLGSAIERPQQAGVITHADFTAYVHLTGLIDVAAEIKRLEKQLGEKEKNLANVRNKLNNAGFLAKAPAEVVAELRESEKATEQQIAVLKETLEMLKVS